MKVNARREGVTLNPATLLTMVEEILPNVDLALIMYVAPGFGGQKSIPASTAKIRRLRQMLGLISSSAWLEVDGGIDIGNAAEVVQADADVLVTGAPYSVGRNQSLKTCLRYDWRSGKLFLTGQGLSDLLKILPRKLISSLMPS